MLAARQARLCAAAAEGVLRRWPQEPAHAPAAAADLASAGTLLGINIVEVHQVNGPLLSDSSTGLPDFLLLSNSVCITATP